jgi:hypothetical protein
MVKAARLGEFQPNRFFFRILLLEIVVLTALFVRQFGMTLPADDGDWPLSIFSLVNLGFAGCIALFAGFFHQGHRFVKVLLLATGTLFLVAPPLRAILPDHTVDYQDWAALAAWFLSFGLIGLILIFERANIVVQALFLGGLILQTTVMFGDLAFDDFLRPDIAVGFMDWAYVLGSAISVLCFLLGFQLFASRAAETAKARAFIGSRLHVPVLARLEGAVSTAIGTWRFRREPRDGATHAADHVRRLTELGTRREIMCIDYGQDGMRIGPHVIEDVEPGYYIGMDLANRFSTDGLERLSADLKQQNPLLLVISKATLRQARKAKADLIFSIDVLRHVPPLELDDFLSRVLGLMHPHTTVVMEFDEGESRFQKNADGWLYGRIWLQQKASRQKQDARISFVPGADRKRTCLVIEGAAANTNPARPH